MNLKHALGFIPAAVGFGVGSFQRGIQAGLSGQWEGSEKNRLRRRPGRRMESQDAGLNFGVREDLTSEARVLAQTFPIARNINRKYANHVVGSCRIKWNTGDPEIDKIYSDRWQDWMVRSDLSGRHHFRKMTKLAVESILRDGKIVGQKDQRGGFLQIAAIEGDRISSHGNYNSDSPTMIGGFGIDGNGRITFARTWKRTLYGTFEGPHQDIPLEQLVHAFDSDRFDAVTGVTAYHTVLNPIRDFKETGEAEILAAKRNSKLALLWKTMMGGATPAAVNLYSNDDSSQGSDKVNVQEVNDVADVYMFPGEEGKVHTSERPSEGWRWLMEFQVRQIAMGLDLPFGVVWHMAGLGGPASRFEIGQANRVFCAFLEDIVGPMWIRPIAATWVTVEHRAGRLPFHPNWYKFRIPAPASITIDLGRDSKSGIAENSAGLLSATEWFAEEDKDFEEETEKMAQEASFRRQMAIKYKVSMEEMRLLTPQGNPGDVLVDESADVQMPKTPLNGAQITAALEVMLKLRESALAPDAAVELMTQIGIDRRRAASMVKNLPKLDTGAGDVSFKRSILEKLLAVPAAREAVYNSLDIEDLVQATGLPPEKDYQAPWIPVVAQSGPIVNGGTLKDPDGDIVGGTTKPEPAPVSKPGDKKPAAPA